MLVNMSEMLKDAEKYNYAIGSLNTPNLESLQAVIGAAEELNCPIIINHAQGHEPVIALEKIAPVMKIYAEKAKVPVAMHIDHCLDFNFAMRAIRAGFTSIMFDQSRFSLEENIEKTKKFVDLVNPLNITVEGELGEMPNNMPTCVPGQEKSDLSDLSVYFTNIEDARLFAEQTKVDVLTISVGTIHGMYEEKSNLDIQRIKDVKTRLSGLDTHIGIHGASGTEPDQLQSAIDAGIRKINYFTAMDTSVAPVLKEYMDGFGEKPINYSLMVNVAKEQLQEAAKSTLELFLSRKI